MVSRLRIEELPIDRDAWYDYEDQVPPDIARVATLALSVSGDTNISHLSPEVVSRVVDGLPDSLHVVRDSERSAAPLSVLPLMSERTLVDVPSQIPHGSTSW